MKKIYQVAYRTPDSHDMHETGDADEAMTLFKRHYGFIVKGGWARKNYACPKYDGDGITEGFAVFTKTLPGHGRCAALLHLHIIKIHAQ